LLRVQIQQEDALTIQSGRHAKTFSERAFSGTAFGAHERNYPHGNIPSSESSKCYLDCISPVVQLLDGRESHFMLAVWTEKV
jgi:hypothetical protein